MAESLQSSVVVTDLPSNENYISKSVMPGNIAPVSTHRKYAAAADGFVALAPIPAKFGTPALANGIIGWLATFDSSTDGQLAAGQSIRLVAHGPAAVRAHHSGWTNFDWAIHAANPHTPSVVAAPTVALAAQNHGNTVVSLAHIRSFDEPGGIDINILRAADDRTHLWRPVPLYQGSGRDYSPPMTPDRLFLSDDEPFLWSYEGPALYGGYFEFTGASLADMVNDTWGSNAVINTLHGNSIETQYHRTGRTGAFRCRIPSYDGMPEPCLVKPWNTDDTRAPEVWLFAPETNNGAPTGRWEIYRSRWKSGQRQRIAWRHTSGIYGDREYLDDDDAFTAGRTTYPRHNRYGFAFETDWRNHAHRVAVVGPFPTANVIYGPNPERDPSTGRTSLITSPAGPQFRIERDRKRYGVLHLVYASFGASDYYGDINAGEVWFCSSRNDGRSWSTPTRALHQDLYAGGGI